MSVDEPNHRAWSIGNSGSCSALGFLSQFSFSAVFYNCMLSYYYLLTVRFGVKRKRFAERYELPMHLLTISYFLVTAAIGVAFGMYSGLDVGFGCWVNDYPKGCFETGNCISHYIGYIFGAIPTLVTFLSLIINNLVIYVYVHSNFNTNTAITKTNDLVTTANNDNIIDDDDEASSSGSHIQAAIMNSLNTKRPPSSDMQRKKQIKEVAIQGMLYVLTFTFSYAPMTVARLMEATSSERMDDSTIYPLLIATSISFPLQGFFNMFVYTRPSYSRIRTMHPELSIFESIRIACFEPSIPKILEISATTDIKKKASRSAERKREKKEQRLWSREKNTSTSCPCQAIQSLKESNGKIEDVSGMEPSFIKQQKEKSKCWILWSNPKR